MSQPRAGGKSAVLGELTELALHSLWQDGHHDGYWPVPDRGCTAWESWVTQMQASEVLGWACVRAVFVETACIGFCTLRTVDPSELPGTSAVECGTWLHPRLRGQGWNEPVKRAVLDLASGGTVLPVPDWCLFVLDADNVRAIAALARLPVPWAADPAAPGQFRALLRRRAWERGHPVTLFAVERSVYLRG